MFISIKNGSWVPLDQVRKLVERDEGLDVIVQGGGIHRIHDTTFEELLDTMVNVHQQREYALEVARIKARNDAAAHMENSGSGGFDVIGLE